MMLTAGIEAADGKSYLLETGACVGALEEGGTSGTAPGTVAAVVGRAAGCCVPPEGCASAAGAAPGEDGAAARVFTGALPGAQATA
jgi:hypothetical protein